MKIQMTKSRGGSSPRGFRGGHRGGGGRGDERAGDKFGTRGGGIAKSPFKGGKKRGDFRRGGGFERGRGQSRRSFESKRYFDQSNESGDKKRLKFDESDDEGDNAPVSGNKFAKKKPQSVPTTPKNIEKQNKVVQDINKIKNDKTKKKSQSVPTTPKKPLQKNRQEEEVEDEEMTEEDESDDRLEIDIHPQKSKFNKGKMLQQAKTPDLAKQSKKIMKKKNEEVDQELNEGSILNGSNRRLKVKEDNDEDEDMDESEEESMNENDENEEEISQKKKDVQNPRKLKGGNDNDDGDNDEEDDESNESDSLEDEDEEEAENETVRSPVKGSLVKKTPAIKSALKTPGTDSSNKKVHITSPPISSSVNKSKTPVTPHPVKRMEMQSMKMNLGLKGKRSSDNEKALKEESDNEEEGSYDDEFEEYEEDSDDQEEKAKVAKQSKNDAKIAAKQSKNDAKSVSQLGIKRKALDESAVTNLNKKAKIDRKEKASENQQQQSILKRPANDSFGTTADKQPKDILSEEQRRKEARDKCSLFVAGIPKKTKAQDLKSLHPDIIAVRHMSSQNFGWLIFADETHCDKAYDAISKQTLKGTPIKVDFCGVKSKMKKETVRIPQQLPINPLELYISGFPPNTTKEQMQLIFRSATGVAFPKAGKSAHRLFCFVTFANEADAKAAFDKGKSLKIGGQPVDVFYARIKKDILPSKKQLTEAEKSKVKLSKNKKSQNKSVVGSKAAKSSDNHSLSATLKNAESDSVEGKSSDEGIIEDIKSQKKSVKKVVEDHNEEDSEEDDDDDDDGDDDDEEEDDGDDDDDDDDDDDEEEDDDDEGEDNDDEEGESD